MSRRVGFRALLDEVHERSIWQVLLAYLGVSWAVLEALDLFSGRYELPRWLFTVALVLLALGLVGLLATALTGTASAASPGSRPRGPDGQAESIRAADARRSGATWRAARLAFVVVMAAWGLVATGWLVSSRGRTATMLTAMEVVAELERFAEVAAWDSAYALAQDVERKLAGDSLFEGARPLYSTTIDILSDPAGANVYRRWYADAESEWEILGTTPITELSFPRGTSRLRFEKDGYEPLELGNPASRINGVEYRLAEVGSDFQDMVWVPGGQFEIRSPGLEGLEPIDLGPYWIDRYEVTNRLFKQFVNAGGYTDSSYWPERITTASGPVSWAAAVAGFTDRTGRPGPATWEGGDYRSGLDDHPVSGVSWYEAAAYARFAGKQLPTIYHWNRAAEAYLSPLIVPQSNLNATGSAPVGEFTGVSGFGASDMGGNAREWCLNDSGDSRFILGGGWNDADYMFVDAYTQPAWDRSETNGFRLASYEAGEDITLAARHFDRPIRDFRAEEPISDEVFDAYRRMYAYDDTPLNGTVESVDSTGEQWIRERVTFDAAYGGERMEALIFAPRNTEPPYQTVVLFPGSGALFVESTDEFRIGTYDFIPENGRAVVLPIYKGTYGRGGGATLATDVPNESVAYRDIVIQWAQDLGRTLDYLETRTDIDSQRLAYFGTSWGGRLGVLMVVVEPRFKAAVLRVAGLKHQRALPEADPSSVVRRVTLPVLMLNGQQDYFFPYETSQLPLYELLGTPAEDKRHMVYPGGHTVPRVALIRETLDWLDRYLGSVGRE